MKVKNTEQYVLDALKGNIRAREDDFILYGVVLKKLGYDLKNTNLYEFLANAKTSNTPSFETVTRCRRKLQEQMPSLRETEITKARQEKTTEFINYSKTRVVKNG